MAIMYGGTKVQFLFSAPLFLFSAPLFLFSASGDRQKDIHNVTSCGEEKKGCGEEKKGCGEEKEGVRRRENFVLWGHCNYDLLKVTLKVTFTKIDLSIWNDLVKVIFNSPRQHPFLLFPLTFHVRLLSTPLPDFQTNRHPFTQSYRPSAPTNPSLSV